MNDTTITKEEAIKIIHEIRSKSPFTMSMSTEEYVDFFRRNYAVIFNEILPHDIIIVATKMKGLLQ